MFRVLFGRLRPQDHLGWRNALHGLSSSRRISRFWYKNRPNPRSYATCRGETSSCCVFIREIRVKILSSEWKYSYPNEGLMTEWKVSIRVKLRSKESRYNPSEWNITIGVKYFRVKYCHPSEILPSEILPSGILPSEWNSSEWNPSEWNIAIRVKFFRVKDCRLSEKLPSSDTSVKESEWHKVRLNICIPSGKLPIKWEISCRVESSESSEWKVPSLSSGKFVLSSDGRTPNPSDSTRR